MNILWLILFLLFCSNITCTWSMQPVIKTIALFLVWIINVFLLQQFLCFFFNMPFFIYCDWFSFFIDLSSTCCAFFILVIKRIKYLQSQRGQRLRKHSVNHFFFCCSELSLSHMQYILNKYVFVHLEWFNNPRHPFVISLPYFPQPSEYVGSPPILHWSRNVALTSSPSSEFPWWCLRWKQRT